MRSSGILAFDYGRPLLRPPRKQSHPLGCSRINLRALPTGSNSNLPPDFAGRRRQHVNRIVKTRQLGLPNATKSITHQALEALRSLAAKSLRLRRGTAHSSTILRADKPKSAAISATAYPPAFRRLLKSAPPKSATLGGLNFPTRSSSQSHKRVLTCPC